MSEVNSLFKAPAAEANWHRAAVEIPGLCLTTATMPQQIRNASHTVGPTQGETSPWLGPMQKDMCEHLSGVFFH